MLFALRPESRGIFRDMLHEFMYVLSEPGDITTLSPPEPTTKTVRTLASLLG